MGIALKEYKTPEGTPEFRFEGVDYVGEYDTLVRVLDKLGAHPVEQLDGIWFKSAKYVLPGGGRFALVFDEDVGIFCHAIDQTEVTNGELRQLLQRMVAWINRALQQR